MFRSYGSKLPTSLTYIVLTPEAIHLGDLLRISVRSATKIIPSHSDFQGPTKVFRTPQEPRCFTGALSLSLDNPIPGTLLLNKEKITLPRTSADVSELDCVTAWGPTDHCWPEGRISVCRHRNINLFPFRFKRLHNTELALSTMSPPSASELIPHLGPANPCATTVHMEPFSTSVFKVLT